MDFQKPNEVTHNSWYSVSDNILTLSIYLQPNAKHNEIVGLHESALKIKLTTPPIEGRANLALIKYLATLFDVPKSNVRLKQGKSSRHKVIEIRESQINPQDLLNKGCDNH